MKILFLDDERLRYEIFLKNHPNDDIVWANSLGRFCEILRLSPEAFDEIRLDHDLNDAGDGDGQDAAFIVTLLPPEKRPKRVIVHSWNPPCGSLMMLILNQANMGIEVIREPFDGGDEYIDRLNDEWDRKVYGIKSDKNV